MGAFLFIQMLLKKNNRFRHLFYIPIRYRKCEAGEDYTIFVIRNNYLQLFGLGDSPFLGGHRF
jgi:hypothetical protein